MAKRSSTAVARTKDGHELFIREVDPDKLLGDLLVDSKFQELNRLGVTFAREHGKLERQPRFGSGLYCYRLIIKAGDMLQEVMEKLELLLSSYGFCVVDNEEMARQLLARIPKPPKDRDSGNIRATGMTMAEQYVYA